MQSLSTVPCDNYTSICCAPLTVAVNEPQKNTSKGAHAQGTPMKKSSISLQTQAGKASIYGQIYPISRSQTVISHARCLRLLFITDCAKKHFSVKKR